MATNRGLSGKRVESEEESTGLTLPPPPGRPHRGTCRIPGRPDEAASAPRTLGIPESGAVLSLDEIAVCRVGFSIVFASDEPRVLSFNFSFSSTNILTLSSVGRELCL